MSALPLLVLLARAHACAPQVAPATLLSVAKAESGLDPLTLGVNGRPHRALHFATAGAAAAAARTLRARGVDFDLGLTQINVRNLDRLGLSLDDAFDPCRSLAAAARVLTQDYLAARPRAAGDAPGLVAALSSYNTGDPVRGLRNGYVAAVRRAAAEVVPAITGPSLPAAREPEPAVTFLPTPAGASPAAPPLDVFARPVPSSLVWPAPSAFTPAPLPSGGGAPRPGDPS